MDGASGEVVVLGENELTCGWGVFEFPRVCGFIGVIDLEMPSVIGLAEGIDHHGVVEFEAGEVDEVDDGGGA